MQSSNLVSNMFWLKKKSLSVFDWKKYSLPKKIYVWAASPCGENWDLCDLIFTRVSSYLNLVWHEKLFPHQICCQAVLENVSELHWDKNLAENVSEIQRKIGDIFLGSPTPPLADLQMHQNCSSALPWHSTEETFPDLASTAKMPKIWAKMLICARCASNVCDIVASRATRRQRGLTKVNLTSWSAGDGGVDLRLGCKSDPTK